MRISVLLVMGRDRRLPLLERLEACGIDVLSVSDCKEARQLLQKRPAVPIVLTDEKLSDGGWLTILGEVRRNSLDAETIVCSRLGDAGLWVRVLAHGAYDLLVEPYETQEVRRIIQAAVSQCVLRVQAVAS